MHQLTGPTYAELGHRDTIGWHWHAHQAHGPTQMRTLAFPPTARVDAQLRTSPAVVAVSALVREVIVALTSDDDPPYTVRQRENLDARGPHVSLHHVSFELRGIDEFARGTGRVLRAGSRMVPGPGRQRRARTPSPTSSTRGTTRSSTPPSSPSSTRTHGTRAPGRRPHRDLERQRGDALPPRRPLAL